MSRIFKIGLFFAVTSIVMLSMFAANGYSSSKRPYVLGADFSITGRASFLGSPEALTVNMMVDQINKKGGINGHPLKVIMYDDESNTTTSRNVISPVPSTVPHKLLMPPIIIIIRNFTDGKNPNDDGSIKLT